MNEEGRPKPALPKRGSPTTANPMVTDGPNIAALLARLDEQELWHRHAQAMWKDGWRAGLAAGRELGRADAEADMAASWHAITEPVAHPGRDAERRIRAAEAGGRRDAAEHERAFTARAYATRPGDRTPAQRGTVTIYPPPTRRRP